MSRDFFSVVLYISWGLLGLVFVKILFFVSMSSRHHIRHRRSHPTILEDNPSVSVIVPGHNESKTLENCINSLLGQTYQNYTIIFVDDGSTDDTLQVAQTLAERHKNLQVIAQKHGGKAAALNNAIGRSKSDIIVCIDADSMFLRDTVEQLVLSFHDKDVVAVGGNVKVANRGNFLARQQAVEYITGLTLQRRAFAHLGCMQVISGAIGAFRRDALLAIGGYSTDTIVEDMDLTIELSRRGYKVVYNPRAIAFTEAPESLTSFLKQRYRWTFGGFQVLLKHRQAIWRSGRIGLIGMPYFLVFPWIEVVVSLLMIISVVHAFSVGDPGGLLLMVLFMTALQTLLIGYALVVDKEDKRFMALALLDSFFYYHLLSFTTLRAGIDFLRKKQAKWNKLERYGKNKPLLDPMPE